MSFLSSRTFTTPLGEIVAISDEKQLYMLAFSDTPSITRDIEKLEKKIGAKVYLNYLPWFLK